MTSDYDAGHRADRRDWQRRINQGEHVTCWRCGKPITPDTPWDLGHNRNRTDRKPECWPCNRATKTHRARERARPTPPHPGRIR